MFAAPPEQGTTLFASLPPALSLGNRRSRWAEERFVSAPMHSGDNWGQRGHQQ